MNNKKKHDSYIYNYHDLSYLNMNTTIVHLKRKNGQVIQDCDVYIGRAWNMGGWNLPQSKWHNPFTVKQYGDQALILYEQYIRASPLMNDIEELRGKQLGCWCVPAPCHGNILVKILDARTTGWKPLTLNIKR
ncbi:Domain of unknown function (DUF4326)-containing protein [uncultured virus]|nr:Domain of unknown function (DUF4326)-containing protein [uncultured virus]